MHHHGNIPKPHCDIATLMEPDEASRSLADRPGHKTIVDTCMFLGSSPAQYNVSSLLVAESLAILRLHDAVLLKIVDWYLYYSGDILICTSCV